MGNGAPRAGVERLWGTWRMVRFTVTVDGESSDVFGRRPQGYLSYGQDGRMLVLLVKSERPRPDDMANVTDEQRAELFKGLSRTEGRTPSTARRSPITWTSARTRTGPGRRSSGTSSSTRAGWSSPPDRSRAHRRQGHGRGHRLGEGDGRGTLTEARRRPAPMTFRTPSAPRARCRPGCGGSGRGCARPSRCRSRSRAGSASGCRSTRRT